MEHPSSQKSGLSQHLSELYSVVRQTIILVILLSLMWGYASDSLMNFWLNSLPLGNTSLNLSIYSPFDWLEIRWTISILLSIMTVMPLLSIRLQRFASPGLLPSERTWFATILAFCTFILPIATIMFWWFVFPIILEATIAADSLEGVGARYDAASIFRIAIGVTWVIVCTTIATVTLSLARLLGLVDKGATRFRNRILAIFAGLLILTLPAEFEGLRILIALISMLVVDRISSSLPKAALGKRRFDVHDISLNSNPIRMAIIDCSCEGVCPKIPEGAVPNGIATPACDAICLNLYEQEALSDLVLQYSITNLVVTGCDASPIPRQLKTSFDSVGCKLSGLGWLDDKRTESDDWRVNSLVHSAHIATETTLD